MSSNKRVPIIAIVGRANVGKSSLFNSILDRREAIVAREAGTTRDSISAKSSWNGKDFWIVDTAGVKDAEDAFEFTIQEQIQQAIDSADEILVVVEADTIITEEDRRVSQKALKSKKPVILVINKIDKVKDKSYLEEYVKLGVKTIIGTSNTQNRGISDLLDHVVSGLPKVNTKINDNVIHLAILGRPNVGKSYLFNTMAKKQQAIVADRAGTTRDINRTNIRFKQNEIELMDTAGIRRSGKIERGVEYFSVIRSLSAIEQADVCLLLIDISEVTVQLDQKIAGMVKEAGKGLVIVVSKWDSLEDKDQSTQSRIGNQISSTYDFVPWAPLIYTSAVTGQNVAKIFDLVLNIAQERKKRITTRELNNWLRQAVEKHPPAGLKNRAPKLNYMVQEADNPIPAFKIFGSHTRFVHWSYRRYLEKQFRETFGFEGTAIQLWFIEKHQTHKHGHSPTKE